MSFGRCVIATVSPLHIWHYYISLKSLMNTIFCCFIPPNSYCSHKFMSCLLFSQILHEDINFSIDKNKQTYSKSHTDGRPRHNVGGNCFSARFGYVLTYWNRFRILNHIILIDLSMLVCCNDWSKQTKWKIAICHIYIVLYILFSSIVSVCSKITMCKQIYISSECQIFFMSVEEHMVDLNWSEMHTNTQLTFMISIILLFIQISSLSVVASPFHFTLRSFSLNRLSL